MSRQPGLDALGTLHHIIVRNIDRIEIFQNKTYRDDFLSHMANAEEPVRVKHYIKLLQEPTPPFLLHLP